MSTSRPCHGCGARRGEPCRPCCVGLALYLERREAASTVNHVSPGAVDGLLGRWMTVRASKLYALLHYRAELDEYRRI